MHQTAKMRAEATNNNFEAISNWNSKGEPQNIDPATIPN